MKLTRTFTAILVAASAGVALAGSTGANPPRPPEEIVFRSDRAGQPDLYLIGRDGSNFRRLTFTEARERTPRISPDGKWIAFSSNAGGSFDIWVMRRDGSEPTQVTSHPEFESDPVWLPDGRIVFVRGPFGCWTTCATAVIVKRGGGKESTLPIGGIQGGGVDVSPDGTTIVYGRSGTLYAAKLDGTGETQLTSPPAGAFDFRPALSPDGTRIAFIRSPNDVENDLAVANADGSGVNVLTDTPGRHEEYASWSKDGQTILFMTFGNDGGRLRQINPDGSGESIVSTDIKAPFQDTFSRDGRDTSVWHEIVTGSPVAVEQVNGRVEVTIGAGAVPGGPFNVIDGHYGSHCTLPGDFDMQIEYEALTWPSANGTQAGVHAFFAHAQAYRESQPWGEQYATWLDGTGGHATTEENSGAIRLIRREGRFRAFWRYEGVWVPLRSAPANSNAVTFGFQLQGSPQYAGQQVKVAFDNFRLNSGAVECPDWWRNAVFGDFG